MTAEHSIAASLRASEAAERVSRLGDALAAFQDTYRASAADLVLTWGMTTREAAAAIGVSHQSIVNWVERVEPGFYRVLQRPG